MNEDLITAYDAIRLAPDKLIYELSQHKNTQEHFQQIRNVDRHDEYKWEWTPIQKAARFIYLNKTCFNGLYRVNASGHFNVPFGRYDNPKIVDVENIYACNSVLSNPCVSISTQSYCDSLKQIQTCVSSDKNVFVYLDPPYIPISVSSSFTSYTKDGFTMNDQLALKQYCDTLTSMGVKWMQSNSAAPVIFTMYSGYKIDTVAVQRKVSASSTSRTVVRETIITNYE
jgi:DNA adenine methylase